MKNIAIICEYNPFHNGHKLQIDKILEKFGSDTNIICIMSGNFVQRGDFAIFDKHTRAKSAILGGANLILELPLPYAISSAEFFAKGAVYVLNQLNCIDYLCFGSECGDIDTLTDISNHILDPSFFEKVQDCMQKGISYPNALDEVLNKINVKFSEIIKNPNNTLGIEYIKALNLSKSTIKPITITREKTGYHSDFEISDISSASYIRKNIESDIFHLMPEKSANNIKLASKFSIYNVENSILSHLKRKDSEFFKSIRDCNEGLENKIVSSLKKVTSLDELYTEIKSKRYTNSRIHRIILNSYLEISKKHTDTSPKYTKVLAFDDKGRQILKKLKDCSEFAIITKPSAEYNLCFEGRELLSLDILSTDLFFMACEDKSCRKSNFEMTTSPVYIKNS
ncbi:MAG: nucleotidyltransferase family protein [Clostridia bacterium]